MSAATSLPPSLNDIVFHVLDPLEAVERDIFLTRAEAWYPDLLDGLTTLYGDAGEEEALNLLALAARAYAERDYELRRLDLARTLDPAWAQHPGRVGYAAYTERFAGTLRGVEDRIDYLRELGVTYLHLMPLLTPRPGDSDGGYAVADYRTVRPDLGTMDDLEHLAGELRAEGISLVVDLVLNHVAAEHEWAVRARAGEQRYRDYFLIFPDRTEPDAYERSLRHGLTTRPALSRPFRACLPRLSPAPVSRARLPVCFIARLLSRQSGRRAYTVRSPSFTGEPGHEITRRRCL